MASSGIVEGLRLAAVGAAGVAGAELAGAAAGLAALESGDAAGGADGAAGEGLAAEEALSAGGVDAEPAGGAGVAGEGLEGASDEGGLLLFAFTFFRLAGFELDGGAVLAFGSLPNVLGGLVPFVLPEGEDLDDPGLLGVDGDGGEPLACVLATGFGDPVGLVYPAVSWGFFVSLVLRSDFCAGGDWQETVENRMAEIEMHKRCSLIFRQ